MIDDLIYTTGFFCGIVDEKSELRNFSNRLSYSFTEAPPHFTFFIIEIFQYFGAILYRKNAKINFGDT